MTHSLRHPTRLLIACCLLLGLATSVVADDTGLSASPAAASAAVLTELGFGPQLAALGPDVEQAAVSPCSASFDCGDGNVASCTGLYHCEAQLFAVPDYVECDGQRTSCPNACVAREICHCGGTIQCSSNTGDCQTGNDTVTCDGFQIDCPNFCLG